MKSFFKEIVRPSHSLGEGRHHDENVRIEIMNTLLDYSSWHLFILSQFI